MNLDKIKEIINSFITSVEESFDTKLDFSPGSIKVADELIEKHFPKGPVDGIRQFTVFDFGFYIGEVIVRNLNGKWLLTNNPIEMSVVVGNVGALRYVAEQLQEGDEGVIVLSATPFYAEGGNGRQLPRAFV